MRARVAWRRNGGRDETIVLCRKHVVRPCFAGQALPRAFLHQTFFAAGRAGCQGGAQRGQDVALCNPARQLPVCFAAAPRLCVCQYGQTVDALSATRGAVVDASRETPAPQIHTMAFRSIQKLKDIGKHKLNLSANGSTTPPEEYEAPEVERTKKDGSSETAPPSTQTPTMSESASSDFHLCDYRANALSILVVGASGDLAAKKTYPSLLSLYRDGYLPKDVSIIGYARSKRSDEEFREKIGAKLSPGGVSDDTIKEFLSRCFYRAGGYDDVERVREVSDEMLKMEKEAKPDRPANRLFYFAIPPNVFADMGRSLKQAAESETGWTRYIIEKPFGKDSDSFEELNKEIKGILDEDSIFRIDHYLGKENVQNLITMRFANSIFEPLWNRDHISSVTISFKENFGTQGRGGYFDQYGIIRDVMQNHLVQVLSLFAMEAPTQTSGNAIRDEKRKVLDCIPPIRVEDCITAQYVADDEGKEPSYTDDDTVPNDSKTPTFATCVLYVNNPRWDGVPFIMRAGKALNERKSEVRVQFKKPPGSSHLFSQEMSAGDGNGTADGKAESAPTGHGEEVVNRNELVIRLQPNEAVYMKVNIKKPGLAMTPVPTELDLSYRTRFPDKFTHIPDAYTRLILQVLRGDHSSFVRDDELRSAWRIFTPLLHAIDRGEIEPLRYKAFSRGPKEHDNLATQLGYVHSSNYTWQAPSN